MKRSRNQIGERVGVQWKRIHLRLAAGRMVEASGSQWKSSGSSSEAQEMAEAGSLFRPKEWHPKVPLHKPPFGVKVVGSARSHGGYCVPYFRVKSPSKFHNNSFRASTVAQSTVPMFDPLTYIFK